MAIAKHVIGGLMTKRGRRPGISEEERVSGERRGKVEARMSEMFEERSRDPFGYVMGLDEQKYYDQRRDQIYGEGREQQQQALMGAMNRTGALASGATNLNLMRFGQQTLRDKQQFYFQDQQMRLQQKEGAIQGTMGMGQAILGSPTLGTQQTDVMNARARQHNEWRNRWGGVVSGSGYA